MWNSIKNAGQVVVKQIPVGIGMGIGVAIAGGLMSGLGKALNKGSEALKQKTKKMEKVVAEHTPTTSVQSAA